MRTQLFINKICTVIISNQCACLSIRQSSVAVGTERSGSMIRIDRFEAKNGSDYFFKFINVGVRLGFVLLRRQCRLADV